MIRHYSIRMLALMRLSLAAALTDAYHHSAAAPGLADDRR